MERAVKVLSLKLGKRVDSWSGGDHFHHSLFTLSTHKMALIEEV